MQPVDQPLLQRAGERFADLDSLPIGLAVLDPATTILYWNGALENWTGIGRKEAVGRPLAELSPVWSKPHYAGRLSHLFSGGPPVVFSPLLHPKIIPLKDEADQFFHVKASAVPDGKDGWWAFLSVEDVSVLTRRVEELHKLHTQQDRMMREIHHRVKNNLNMISGFITLQRSQPSNEGAQSALADVQSRIVAISEIHDILYHSASLTITSTADYLGTLAKLLDENLSITGSHALILELDSSIVLKTDSTVLLGLIQAELMTNAIKYSLGRQNAGTLRLRLVRLGDGYEYELAHSGDHLPADFNPETSSGLGMVLLTAYAGQLGTRLGWEKGDPTRFWLRFNE